ncbi:MAG: hypothetical protein DSM106950_44955 [Stigonema ocellatum SAG 48.90 = DSM 106950]|nr:hypothetical protein [Stigonema ocellatum SAG 48.90 = DSM 106950]
MSIPSVQAIQEKFLDTSVMRSLLLATQAYQQYLKSQLSNSEVYISNYVRMEIKRSYIINIISFYFVLRLDGINTIGDAITLWSNKFKGSELKAILQVIPQLFSTRQLNFASPEDKQKALSLLAIYIKRFDLIIKTKFNYSEDYTVCARALVPLNIDLKNPAIGLNKFVLKFEDTKTCRSQCNIDQFLLIQYRYELEQIVEIASQIPRNTKTRGFLNIAHNLKEILISGATACDCKRCEKIGDAVIALNTPRNLQLEHTDNSFDYLCPPIKQPHQKHSSENEILMKISASLG